MDFDVRYAGREKPRPPLIVDHDRRGGRFELPESENVHVGAVVVEEVDFSRLRFWAFDAAGSTFIGCDFGRTRFEGGSLSTRPQVRYLDCSFERADLRHIPPDTARFEHCSFDGARLHDWICDTAEFIDCSFATKLTECRFSGTPWGVFADSLDPPRTANEFRGNDFSRADIRGCSFDRGIDIDAQRWPEDADQYIRLDRFRERFAAVRAIVARWPDDERRKKALLMLRIIEEGRPGQDVLFHRRHESYYRADVEADVWRLAEAAL